MKENNACSKNTRFQNSIKRMIKHVWDMSRSMSVIWWIVIGIENRFERQNVPIKIGKISVIKNWIFESKYVNGIFWFDEFLSYQNYAEGL